MINIMYIVLTAMLALNVSSDVLNGFNRVHVGLERTSANLSSRNATLLAGLDEQARRNPAKASAHASQARQVDAAAAALCTRIDSLKWRIARKADGASGRPDRLVNRENLDAAAEVMLSPMNPEGEKLQKAVEAYAAATVPLVADPQKREIARRTLSLKGSGLKSWATESFEGMPAVGAVALLTQLQTDVLQVESDAIASLADAVDAGDVRVNHLAAYVIPNSRIVMQGTPFEARIVLAAVDTTQRPRIVVGGRALPAGTDRLDVAAGAPGRHELSGYIESSGAGGEPVRYPFATDYTVVEPAATISASMMNVLYAGIDNPVEISVPGAATQGVSATMTNGTLTRKGAGWVARPAAVGQDAEISVSAEIGGRTVRVGTTKFRVRRLPDPTPYIVLPDGGTYKGTPRRISKSVLLAAERLGAAADDNMLDVAYSVVSFQTMFFDSMGNAMPASSDGARFSARQKEQMRALKSGRRFFITSVKAKGPDGVVRDISPMEVAIN